MRCSDAAPALPAVADGSVLHPDVAEHVASCLRCQADLARYRRLGRDAGALAGRRLSPPPDRVSRVLEALDLPSADRRRRHDALVRIGLAAALATAAVLALAVVLRRRAAARRAPAGLSGGPRC